FNRDLSRVKSVSSAGGLPEGVPLTGRVPDLSGELNLFADKNDDFVNFSRYELENIRFLVIIIGK
ncbi:MAG: hypothetical protein IKX88_16900, partial [Thermoguttaceae bacterium]|nr:hypothetical protein [Thermoguttaceae bacterium]